jgi:hypothetical protein
MCTDVQAPSRVSSYRDTLLGVRYYVGSEDTRTLRSDEDGSEVNLPAGTFHAIDADTGNPACGTQLLLVHAMNQDFEEPTIGNRCPECVARVASV